MHIDWAFNQDAFFKRFNKSDGWGKSQRDAMIPVKVWWQMKYDIVKMANGEDKKSDAVVKGPLSLDPKENDAFVYKDRLYRVLTVNFPPSIYGEITHFSARVEEVAS